MATTFQAIRGMNDILPSQIAYWQFVEGHIRQTVAAYGYEEIRFPIVEKTGLFKRSVGEVTDIVEKEMYTFDDRNQDSLSLRPEGTAGCVRAGIEHGLLYNQIQRLWYMGPMFRHERPQKGRSRQFEQLGVEAFGMAGPEIDAELILMTVRLWDLLGLTENVSLHLNSLGSLEARALYREKLVEYFSRHRASLDEDSVRRLSTNPLRILDSKNPAMADIIHSAPRFLDDMDSESKEHFEHLCALLDKAKVAYKINPFIVRGLDYYNRTVFEWITTELGAQGTVCAGGRYDGLVEQLGGKATPASGFAMGLDRVVALMENKHKTLLWHEPHAYLMSHSDAARTQGLLLAETLRTRLPWLNLIVDCSGAGIKSQFKRAVASQASIAIEINQDHTIELKVLNSANDTAGLIKQIEQVL